MQEKNEENQSCCCDCCHCKKIFMAMVIIILAFIAGIMVGNCRQQYYIDMPYANPYLVQQKMHHRGAPIKPQSSANIPQTNPSNADTNAALGGYIIEVEQAN